MTPTAVFRIDPANQCVWRSTGSGAERRLNLAPKAFQVLQYLVDNRDRLITHDELLRAIWPNADIQPEVLKSHILAIRTALGDKADSPQFVETLRGRGYRFMGSRAAFRVEGQDRAPALRAERIVGREDSLESLARSAARARGGDPQIVLVTGEPGIGKSALIHRFLAPGADAPVGIAQCLEGFGGGSLPYQPVLEALGTLCEGPRSGAVLRTLLSTAPAWAAQMPSRLNDEQRARLSHELLGGTRERLLREGCEFLDALAADQPLVLVFEDLQWADFATLDFLAALATRRTRARRLLILSYRPRELEGNNPHLLHWVTDLVARKLASQIALSPLSERAVSELLDGPQPSLPVRELSHLMWQRAGGNPLFLLALLDDLRARGLIAATADGWHLQGMPGSLAFEVPETLSQLIAARFERLSADQHKVLEAGCAAGMSFNAAVCAPAVELDPAVFEELCEELCRRSHFLSRGEVQTLPDNDLVRHYAFNHSLYRHVLYERLGPIRRARLQLALAERLEELYPQGERGPLVEELAQHFAAGRNWPRALDYLRLSLKTAHRRFAYRDALAVLDRAMAVTASLAPNARAPAELEFLERRAALYGASHDGRALEIYLQLVDKAAQLGSVGTQVRALLGCAHVASWYDLKRSLLFLDRALPLTDEPMEAVARYRARITIHVRRIWVAGWSDSDADACDEAAQLLEAQSDELASARGSMDLSMIVLLSTRYRLAHDRFVESYRLLLASADADVEADAARAIWMYHVGMPWALLYLGDFGAALAHYAAGIATFKRNGDLSSAVALHIYTGLTLFFGLDYEGVLEACEPVAAHVLGRREYSGPEGARILPVEQRLAVILCGLAELHRGHSSAALEYFLAAERAMQNQPVHLDWYWRLPLEWGMTRALLADGRQLDAQARVEGFIRLAEQTREYMWHSIAWQTGAWVALARGAVSDAIARADKALSATRSFETPLADWRAHDVAARAWLEAGDERRALDHNQHSLAIRRRAAATLPEGHPMRARLEEAPP